MSFFPDYFPPQAYYDVTHGDIRICRRHPSFDDHRQPLTTGNFHGNHSHAFNPRYFENIGEFLDVGLGVVEFRAPHHEHLALEKITMEIGVGEGRAVGSNEQIRSLQERRGRRH